jgi:hypothetical protein
MLVGRVLPGRVHAARRHEQDHHAPQAKPAKTVADCARLHGLCSPQGSFEDDVLRAVEGPQLALDLHRRLGDDLAGVMALRAAGAEPKAIAVDQQVAISTAHQWITTGVMRIGSHARRRRVGPSTLEPMPLARGR